jgi:DNA repair exonuclease SbcCD ATPase subunit
LRKDIGEAREIMEAASQSIDGRIDSFSKDYYERIAWASEQLESKILEKVEHRLEEYEGDASYRFHKLEEVNLDIVSLEKNLRDVMGRISEQIEGDMNSFAKLIEERRDAEETRTDTLISKIHGEVSSLEDALDGLKEKAYREVEGKLKDFEDEFFTDLNSRSEGMERSIHNFQREISERLEKAVEDQGKELEQIERRQAEALNSRLTVFQSSFDSSLEDMRDELDSQRQDIILKTREEREELRSELAGIEGKIGDLKEQLDDKTVSVFSEFQRKQEELDQDFRLKSDSLKAEIDEQVAAFRSVSSDIKEKTETFREKLFGQIEENYRVLAQKLADIEEQQKDFLAQTKLFKKADSFKADLERNIGELKKNLTLLEPQRKDMQVIEAEFRNTRAIVEDVSAKLARFQAERKRIEDLEKNFNRLVDLSQTVDGKLDSVTNHHDLLEDIQVKIRQIEEKEEEIESRYVRLEKKKSVLDNTAQGVEKNFRFLSDLEDQVKQTSSTLMGFQPQIEGISGTLELLSAKKEQAETVVDKLERLDSSLGEIEDRMEKLKTAREWLANTETRLESLGKQAQDQVNLLRTLIKAEADSGKERGAPPVDKRQTVLKLARLGWKPKEIAQTTQISRGEVELILELAPQAK